MNRPEKRNALSVELCRALLEAVERASEDRACRRDSAHSQRAVILRGDGSGRVGHSSSYDQVDIVHEQLFTVGARLEKPLIAAVHGPALGGGTGLVANCHIVVASEEASFGLTEIRLGLWPFLVYSAMVAAVGERRTMALR